MLQYPGTEVNGHATSCQLSCIEEEEEGKKNLTEINCALSEVCGETQWTVARFIVRLIVFLLVV